MNDCPDVDPVNPPPPRLLVSQPDGTWTEPPRPDCMICDLYDLIDKELAPGNLYAEHGLDRVSGFIANSVTVRLRR